MDIKKTNSINFKSTTIIATKTPIILNALYDVDYHILKKQKNPKCRFEHISTMADKDGIWYGIIRDGADLNININDAIQKADSLQVSSLDGLWKNPVLKKLKSVIIKQYKEMIS